MTAIFWLAAMLGLAASVCDVCSRRIPNWLIVGGLAAAFGCAIPAGWLGLVRASLGAAAGFLLLLPLHLRGAMGGGDVKLLAAFGALLGPAAIAGAAVFAAIIGGIWAVVARLRGRRSIAYAPAITLGVWFVLLGGV